MAVPVNPNRGELDGTQILQRAFDESQDKIRVDSSVSVGSITGEVAVEIDAADGDNIAIANEDGSKKVTVTTIGGKEALDVNIANSIGGISVPTIQNINIVSANTEQTLVIPSTAKRMTLQLRNVATLKISFVSGQSGTNYYTIFAGSSYEIPDLDLSSSLNLYYQASKATTMEVLFWS